MRIAAKPRCAPGVARGRAVTEPDAAYQAELDALLGARGPRHRRRQLAVTLLLAVAALALFSLIARFVYGTSSPWYTAPVASGDLSPQLVLRGEIHADGEWAIPAPRDGVVLSLPDPDRVRLRMGQVLVGLDPGPATRALADDTAQVALATLDQGHAQEAVAALRERLDRYEMVWQRSEHRVPSLNEMERARADLARAERDLADARVRQTAARARTVRDRSDIATASVRAPGDGFIVACPVTPGQAVRAGQTLCTMVAHPDLMRVYVPLTTAQAARLPATATARVLVDGLPDVEFGARLMHVAPRFGSDGATREAVFTLDLPPGADPATRLHMPTPGRSANVRIALAPRSGVLLVPRAALGFSLHGEPRGAQPGVYVADGDHPPRFVVVTPGASNGESVEVLSGELHAGDAVIIGWRRDSGGR